MMAQSEPTKELVEDGIKEELMDNREAVAGAGGGVQSCFGVNNFKPANLTDCGSEHKGSRQSSFNFLRG